MSQPVLSPDYWGGYLIYRLYPRNQVAIDDRHDLYGDQVLASYLKMVHLQPGWDGFLREHKVACVIMPRNAALTAMLAQTPGWLSIYSDDVAVMFDKRLCQRRFAAAGVPVPLGLGSARSFDELMDLLRATNRKRLALADLVQELTDPGHKK